MSNLNRLSLDKIWKPLFILVLFFYAIKQAAPILIPIVFSFFLSIILNPLVKFLEDKGLNKALAIIITLITVTVIVGGGIYYVGTQARNLFTDLPDLVERFNRLIDRIGKSLSQLNGFSTKDQIDLIRQNSDQLISSGTEFFTGALLITSSLLQFFTLVPIYVFFILMYRKNFKNFLQQLDQKRNQDLITMATEVKSMVHNYIAGLSIVISIIAVLNTIGLLALGLKYAIFMGVVSAILTIIPYIGIFIGGLLPVVVALLTKDSLFYPLAVIGLMGFVQFLEGNFITPKIIGSKVNVNPLAAIIALVIGAQLWGIVGMILAIPLTGIIKIIFSHYDRLRPYSLLLQSDQNNSDETTAPIKDMDISKRLKI